MQHIKDMNTDYPLAISHYYGNSYRRMAKELAGQCEAIGIDYIFNDVSEKITAFIEEKFSHLTNVCPRKKRYRYIPFFVREMFQQTGRNLLVLHADSTILKKPPREIFDGVDVGWAVGKGKGGRDHLLANPLYFKQCETAKDFIDIWCFKSRVINVDYSEHKTFGATTRDYSRPDSVRAIPNLGSRDKSDNPYVYF